MIGYPEIPGCKINKLLDEGGMAKVYLGTQKELDRKVVIKILEPYFLKSKTTEKRFQKEAKIAAKLSHPNIIQIFDTGKAGNCNYIIMELLEDSLRDRMKEEPDGKIEPQIALKIVEKIMEALNFAHEKKIYHRDIKPENIMFKKDGTPVLVDFGIAQALNSPDLLTKSGQSIGTVYYMSPEQCKARKEVDGRSDIYSLGIVLYEMLTGKKPYDGDSFVSIALSHIQDPVPNLPQDLIRYQPLIDRMMAKNRKKRLANLTQFKQLVEKIIRGSTSPDIEPVELPPIPPKSTPTALILKKLRKAVRKHWLKKQVRIAFLVILWVVLFFIIFNQFSIQKEVQQIQEKYDTAIKYINNGDYKKAQQQVDELKELDPVKAEELINKIVQKKEEELKRYITEVKNLIEQNNPEKAREILEQAKKILEETRGINKTQELEALEKRVNDEYAGIRKQLEQIQDDKAYLLASSKNTIESYNKYLLEYPKGLHTEETKWKINKLKTEAVKKQKERIDLQEMEILIKRYNFFESKLNKKGNFKSFYEVKKRKNVSVVMDYPAGLMWYNEKSPGNMDFKKAEKWIKDLNQQEYGGYSDWRIPTLEEAASLLRKRQNKQGLYVERTFSGNQKIIWTQDRFSANSLWVVNFDKGWVKISVESNQKNEILPVRSLE
jgi:tRNA A-37 threonylcarbamoyl transferase component Bud32